MLRCRRSDLIYCTGDVAELYPAAIEALVLNLSALLLPEAVFLRSLVILYCFGPYVLGKGEPLTWAKSWGSCLLDLRVVTDAVSGWLLKHVSETLRL